MKSGRKNKEYLEPSLNPTIPLFYVMFSTNFILWIIEIDVALAHLQPMNDDTTISFHFQWHATFAFVFIVRSCVVANELNDLFSFPSSAPSP